MRRTIKIVWAACAALGLASAQAQTTYLWTNNVSGIASGDWSTALNWKPNGFPNSPGDTADFSSMDIQGDSTINLDANRTVGNLKFGDTTSSSGWSLNPGSGDTLTLAGGGGTSTFTVTNQWAAIAVNLAGTNKLVRAGGGTGILAGLNSYTGGTVVNGGAYFGINSESPFGTGTLTLGEAVGSGQLFLTAYNTDRTITNNVEVRTIRFVNKNNGVAGLEAFGLIFTGNMVLNMGNSNVRDIYCERPMTFNGVVSGGGTNGVILKVGVLTLGNANTYTGPTILESGVNLRLNSPSGNAIPAGSMTYLRGGRIILDASEQIPDNNLIAWPSAVDSRLVLNGFNETLGGLFDQTGNGPRVIEAATDFINDKPATLTLNIAAGTNFTYSGYLRDAPSATGSQLTVIKKGLGAQILTGGVGLLNWSGNTIVQQGVLELRNAAAVSSLVVVSNGATFALGAGVRTAGMEGAGTVVKVGTGTAAYQAGTFDVHTGPTIVSNGVLRVDGEISYSPVSVYSPGWLQGSGYVASTATLAGGSLSPGEATLPNTLNVSNLTAAAGATLQFDLQTDLTPGSGINDLLLVTNLSITGPVTVQVNPLQPLSVGRYVIIQYSNSGLGLNQLSLGAPFLGSRYQPTLDTSKPGEVAIVIGSAPAQVSSTLTWQGGVAGNTWDIGVTTNWLDASILPDAFFNQDTVLFDDTGSAAPAVNLTVAAYPGSVSFNNASKNYTLAGTGKITGTAGVTKAGSGTVTIQTGNDYAGNTVVNEGSLTLSGNNSLSGNSIVNSGQLTLSGSNLLAGSLTVNATATAQLSGTNTLLSAINASGGATRVNGGLLTVNSVGINNDARIIVENGGRIVRNSGPINHGNTANTSGAIIEVAGAGSSITIGNQTINHGTQTGSMSNLIVLRDGGAWLNQGNNYVMPNGSGATGQGLIITNGGRFTWMTGGAGNFLLGHSASSSSNYIQVIGASSVMDLANVAALYVGRNGTNNTLLIDAGLVTNATAININDNGAGLANGAWIINGGRYYGGGIGVGLNANATNSFLIVDNGFVRASGLTVGNNANSNAVIITGTSDVGIGTLTAVRVGSPLHFRGGSVIATNGTIGNGQIFTAGDGVQTASFGVAGVFNATNGVVIPANSTLRGNGTINGSVTNNGTLRPGFADLATLTITNVLKLNNAAVMRVARTNGAASDRVAGLSTVVYGGTLTVTNVGGTLAAGDSFQLFSAATRAGTFASVSLPPLETGKAWTNRLDLDGSIAVLATMNTTPTNISYTISGNTLTVSWPASHLGWTLQAQTNSVSTGLSGNWVNVPGSTTTTSMPITIDPAAGTVFFRLVTPAP